MVDSVCAVSESDTPTYCVTGSTGYIGSWLVRSLLERGYNVHATARDPGSYVQYQILDPAIKGTLNLLKSCSKEKSIKRVVFTSSISTITAKDPDGKWKPIVDESCQTPVDHVWHTRASGWVYVLSKLLSEEAAFKFANENGFDLVSIITPTVAGPFLTPTVPVSIRVLLSPVTGEVECNSILTAVNNRMGSISLVHIEDICNAHIFLMEQATAEGRYICSAQSCVMSQLLDCLAQGEERISERKYETIPSVISSKKLEDLGFKYKFGLKELMEQSISCCMQHGFLKQSSNNKKDCPRTREEFCQDILKLR